MGNKKTSKRNRSYVRKRRAARAAVPEEEVKVTMVDEGKNKRMRQRFKQKDRRRLCTSNPVSQFLKFGSINVDGITEASRYGVETLLEKRNYDVNIFYHKFY